MTKGGTSPRGALVSWGRRGPIFSGRNMHQYDRLGKSEGGAPSIFFSPSISWGHVPSAFDRNYAMGTIMSHFLPFHENTCPRPTFLCNVYYYLSCFAIPCGHVPPPPCSYTINLVLLCLIFAIPWGHVPPPPRSCAMGTIIISFRHSMRGRALL